MTHILITGSPGVGKTTCIKKIARSMESRHPFGFYTEELREHGTRVGFELVGLDGQRKVLAHVGISSRYRVGKYQVDISGFEEYLSSMPDPEKDSVVIIDEIGKMECLSPVFRDMITRLLGIDIVLVATIAQKGDHFIETIKMREDVTLYTLTRINRDVLPGVILEAIPSMNTGISGIL
jgi:nucleoside-triphosphatase